MEIEIDELKRVIREVVKEAVNEAIAPVLRSRSEELLTVTEAAELLKVSPQSIHTWFREGKLTRIKCGRSTRIAAKEIEEKLAEGKLYRYGR